MNRVRLVLGLLTALVAALALAGGADALTRPQANAVALKALAPQKLKGPAILFGLAAPLGAKAVVVEAGSPSLTAVPFVPRGAPLGKRAWLFWLDQAAYAQFLHPSRLLLVDDATGKVLRSVPMSLYPLVDGKRPAFLASWPAYRAAPAHVWSNIPGDPGTRKTAASSQAAGAAAPLAATAPQRAAAVPKDAFKDDCLVSLGLRDDPLFSGDFTGITGWAQGVGLASYRPGNGPGGRAPGGAELAGAVNDLTGAKHCKDVMIFISGHGYPGPRYPAAIQTGASVEGQPWTGVRASDLQGILRAHPQTTFKIKLNGCYSGRFVDELKGERNLLVLETAANGEEYSWGPLPARFRHPDGRDIDVPAHDNPGRSEFVNGNLAGLTAFYASADEVQRAQTAGGSLLARSLGRAFELGAGADGARLAGLTHPRRFENYPDFALKPLAGYRHFTGSSEVCGIFGTEPAQPGATVTAAISGPGVSGPAEKVSRSGSLGEGAFAFAISAYGTYTVTLTVTAGGLTRTSTSTVVVTAAPGTCPG